MKKFKLIIALSVVPFALSACGEGWERIQTHEMFPYGNQRTAGTGVAYVLAKMMPEKELIIKTVPRRAPPKKVKRIEKVFKDAQAK